MRALKQGTINLKTNDAKTLQIQIQDDTIDLNILQKEPLKALLKLQTPTIQLDEQLKNLKNTAEQLKNNGITIKISYQNQLILVLGAEAHPALLQIITGTDAIEIHDLVRLTELLS